MKLEEHYVDEILELNHRLVDVTNEISELLGADHPLAAELRERVIGQIGITSLYIAL
jgi:hypothetical protein